MGRGAHLGFHGPRCTVPGWTRNLPPVRAWCDSVVMPNATERLRREVARVAPDLLAWLEGLSPPAFEREDIVSVDTGMAARLGATTAGAAQNAMENL